MSWLSIHRGVDLLPVPFDKNIEEGDLVVGLCLLGEFDGWVLVVDVVVESRANGYPKRMIEHSLHKPANDNGTTQEPPEGNPKLLLSVHQRPFRRNPEKVQIP